MNAIKLKLAAGLLLGCATVGAQACDVGEQKVLEVMTDEVGVYDAEGVWKEDVKKAEIPLKQTILQCKESPAMVEVTLTPDKQGKPRTGWVNLLEVRVTDPARRQCKDAPVSRVADTATPATSGIDPCSNARQ